MSDRDGFLACGCAVFALVMPWVPLILLVLILWRVW